jgi:uncharacterized membrane protein
MLSGKASSKGARRFEDPVFTAVIHPHRSLDRKAFRTLMTLCCLAATGASVPFVVLGVWPVAGFLGLAPLGLYVAFRLNFRAARSFEEVVLTRIELLFRRVGHGGERSEWRFNPLWTKLECDRDDEFGLQRLALISRGERVVVARELSPPEREGFADALGTALDEVRRGM